jgi:hypothetical protein
MIIDIQIRSLLLDYLTNDVHATSSVQSTATSLNEMFNKRKAKDSSKVVNLKVLLIFLDPLQTRL